MELVLLLCLSPFIAAMGGYFVFRKFVNWGKSDIVLLENAVFYSRNGDLYIQPRRFMSFSAVGILGVSMVGMGLLIVASFIQDFITGLESMVFIPIIFVLYYAVRTCLKIKRVD